MDEEHEARTMSSCLGGLLILFGLIAFFPGVGYILGDHFSTNATEAEAYRNHANRVIFTSLATSATLVGIGLWLTFRPGKRQ